jgi:hypothetical protein
MEGEGPYVVVTSYSSSLGYCMESLLKQVNKYITRGWKPQGGICINKISYPAYNDYLLMQALYKPLPEEQTKKNYEDIKTIVDEISSLKTSLASVTNALITLAQNINKHNIPIISEHSDDPDKI